MNTKYSKKINILIYGCGSIGFRHLQSFLKSKYYLEIYVIEKNNDRILKVKDIIQYNKNNKIKFFFSNNLRNFQISFYLAIVATNSGQRLDSIKILLKQNNITYLILEKLLSSNIVNLKKMQKFISKRKTNIYVNTPRRFMQIYRDIKKQINKNDLVSISFSGSGWNFSSNAIHFIDLFVFLSANKNLKKGSFRISDKIISKRKGYSEFYGSMYLYNTDGAILELSDLKEMPTTSLIIKTKKYKFIIYETFGIYFRISNKNNKDIKINKFKMEFQSVLTYKYFECLHKNMPLNLPNFEDSYYQHLTFYEIFFDEIHKKNHKNIHIS